MHAKVSGMKQQRKAIVNMEEVNSKEEKRIESNRKRRRPHKMNPNEVMFRAVSLVKQKGLYSIRQYDINQIGHAELVSESDLYYLPVALTKIMMLLGRGHD
jgi:hypothetical protein